MTTATIPAQNLDLLLASHRLRKYSAGRTGQFCLLSAAPVLTTHCHDRHRAAVRRDSPRYGLSRATFQPLQRGGISELYERVNRQQGRAEVRRTWGAGIRALRAEPRYTLNGGTLRQTP